MKDDLSYLEACAKKATKGKWIAVGSWVENERDDMPDIVCTSHDHYRGPHDNFERRLADAEYIAAAQPEVIRQLIAELRELRAMTHNV